MSCSFVSMFSSCRVWPSCLRTRKYIGFFFLQSRRLEVDLSFWCLWGFSLFRFVFCWSMGARTRYELTILNVECIVRAWKDINRLQKDKRTHKKLGRVVGGGKGICTFKYWPQNYIWALQFLPSIIWSCNPFFLPRKLGVHIPVQFGFLF